MSTKPSIWRQNPKSKAAESRVWEAYDQLSDAEKKRILKCFNTNLPSLFTRMLNSAKLLRGVTVGRVVKRELQYGKIVDAFLREFEEGKIGANVLREFFCNEEEAGYNTYIKKGSDSLDVRKLLSEIEEEGETALNTLFVRYVEAFINLEEEILDDDRGVKSGQVGQPKMADDVMAHDGKEAESPQSIADEVYLRQEGEPISPTSPSGFSVTTVLDQILDDVAGLIGQAKIAKPWIEDDWQKTISDAREAVAQVRAEVRRLATAAGRDFPEWETREQLDEVLTELNDAGDGILQREKFIKFFKALETEIRALNPSHKLLAKREKLALERDAAADEISGAQKHEFIQWIDDEPGDAREWLKEVMKLDEPDLERMIISLGLKAYPKTASLVEDLDQGYKLGEGQRADVKTEGILGEEEPGKPPIEQPVVEPESPRDISESPPISQLKEPVHEDNRPPTTPKVYATSALHLSQQEPLPEPELPQKTVKAGGSMGESPQSPKPHATVTIEFVKVKEPSPALPSTSLDASPWQSQEGSETEDEVFAPLGDLGTAASVAMKASESEVESIIETIIWNLLGKGERALAFEVLKNANETGLTNAFPLDANALEILALLPAYSSNSSEVPHRIRTILQSEDFSGVFKDGKAKVTHLRNLLLCAALLSPSLFNPSSGAGAELDRVRLGKFPSLHQIATALTEFGRKGVDLNATILLATRNTKGWKVGENEVIEALQRFQNCALSRKMNYAPATWIWRHWFQDRGGWMRGLFAVAVNQDRESMEKLTTGLQSLNLEEEIKKGWEESNGRGQLVGLALGSLRRLSHEAIDLLLRRLDHWKSGPDQESDYRQRVLGDLADTFARNLAPAKQELSQMADADEPFDERNRIAINLLFQELDRLSEALEGINVQIQFPGLKEWLCADLVRLDSVEMNNSMDVSSSPIEDMQNFSEFWNENDPARIRLASELLALRNPIQNCVQAFDCALSRSDHQKAGWILDQMARNNALGLSELEGRKISHLEETRNRLNRELKVVEGELGSAFSKGWITPNAHEELLDLIQRRVQNLSDKSEGKNLPYQLWEDDIEKVRRVIEHAHSEQVIVAEKSLSALAKASPEDIDRVKAVISKGNVYLANEYIQRLNAGESIKHNEDTVPNQFFTDFYGESAASGHFAELQELLSSPSFNPAQAVSDIQKNENWCGINLQGLDSASRSESAAALYWWFSARNSKKIDEKGVKMILCTLHFPITHIAHTRDAYIAHLEGVIPCPIPDYGSEIRSHKISVIVELQRTSVDDVAQHLDRLRLGTNPVILLWMRPIELRLRRKFARICRQKSLKVLMVDSILASYLFTVESQRLRALFECGLPFTNISPYTTSGGMLPEEMFYGRRREIEAIESAGQAGTCFVYGGRQIGKTVLLRKVERDFPKSSPHYLALYLDLNFHAVGQTVAMDEIWKIVAVELSKKDVTIFGKTARSQFTVENFCRRVLDWLQANNERRILLLLDESDQFLRSDGEAGDLPGSMPFRICHKLRGLMDDTRRRFKVVFAGLHNVQRSTRVANNPLAQLGIPVCVGPLYQNGEAREAGRLVSVPLAVSGVFFDSFDTVNSILARTNYYPNLVQILCTNLLRTIVDRQSNSHPEQTPPYQVNPEDVERIFADHEVRDELRKKFMLTLDLDRRFSLIAHLMAFTSNDMPDGYTASDIQRDAVVWWPAGFEADRQRANDSLREDLVVLLNEMCGLGILRRDAKDHYFLRSPNVVSLLGSPNDVERVLEAASHWDVAPPYSPDSFRTPTTPTGDRSHWRSPLTARQETLIMNPNQQVLLISGNLASGINEVQDRLESMMGQAYMFSLSDVKTPEDFEQSFTRLAKREETGKTVLFVPSEIGWNIEWISIAKRRLGKLTAKDRDVGVVFLADSARIWELMPQWKDITKEVSIGGHIKLQRWDNAAVRQWLADTGLGGFDNLRWMHEVTGGWHKAIHILGDYVRAGKSIEALVQSEGKVLRLFSEKLSLGGDFGFPEGISVRILEILAELGGPEPVSSELLHEFFKDQVGGRECTEIASILDWAEAVDAVAGTPAGWKIDPFIGRFLKKRPSDHES